MISCSLTPEHDPLGEEFDAVVLLQPTSPLTDVEDVAGAVDIHRRTRLPVVSVCAADHPAEWLFTVDEGGELLLPADEALEDIDAIDVAPAGDDEEEDAPDAPVGALEDIDLEIEE